MTPDQMAEALERARYESLRGSVWDDLREGERTARVEVARTALEQAGLISLVADLTARADRSADLDGLLAQRDAEIGRRIAEHEAELLALRTERDEAVARLESDLATARSERDDAEARAAEDRTRADAADALVAAVRQALDGPADAPAAEPTEEELAPPADPAPGRDAQVPVDKAPKGRFGRLAKADRR